MNILVIGNGFDLALGLPTKYEDFLEFTRAMNMAYNREDYEKSCGASQCMSRFKKRVKECRDDKIKNKLKEQDSFFMKFKRAFENDLADRVLRDFHYCTYHNIWMEYFQYRYDNNGIAGENWIDFEQEIKSIIKLFDDVFDVKDKLATANEKRELNNINLQKYVDKLKSFQENSAQKPISAEAYRLFKETLRHHFDKFVMALGIYLDFFVPSFDCKDTFSPDISKITHNEKNRVDCVLSFNYVNNFYRKYVDELETPGNTCYVHGAVNYVKGVKEDNLSTDQLIKMNNMIIGFDEYLGDDKKNEKLDFVYYRKYFQRISKGTGSQYLGWLDGYKDRVRKPSDVEPTNGESRQEIYDGRLLDAAKKTPNRVIIFGHSLDATDKDIFKDIFLREPNDTKVTIYYHDEEAHERIITNLIRMLTQEVLIEKTHGPNPDIEFIAQTK